MLPPHRSITASCPSLTTVFGVDHAELPLRVVLERRILVGVTGASFWPKLAVIEEFGLVEGVVGGVGRPANMLLGFFGVVGGFSDMFVITVWQFCS